MILRLAKTAFFAAAAAMIVPVAFLTGVLQHRAELHRIYRRYRGEGCLYRRLRLRSLRKLFRAVRDAVAGWLAEEECYRIPIQETDPHPSVMV